VTPPARSPFAADRRPPLVKGAPLPPSRFRAAALAFLVAALGFAAAGRPTATAQDAKPGKLVVPPPPRQFPEPQLGESTLEATRFVRADDARVDFKVNGKGLTAAVLDTGLNTQHVDFAGRVPAQKNFTSEGGADDATDTHGHGTNVAGIIAANKDHVGIAPGASLIPLKVLGEGGSLEPALQWVLDNHKARSITVVNMSLSDRSNHTDPDAFAATEAVRVLIKKLKDERVAVVVAAGNEFYPDSKEGMGYPAIFPDAISVGAVYDADNIGEFTYPNGAKVFKSAPGRITPFSQRLHPKTDPKKAFTDVFAPGAPVTSSGKDGPTGESIQSGTSQATPVTAGVVLLMQEYYLRSTNERPTVDQLKKWIREGAATIYDGKDDKENVTDNVKHPAPENAKQYPRLDALGSMKAVQRELRLRLLKGEKIKK
jgi:subtilisin family serine protease